MEKKTIYPIPFLILFLSFAAEIIHGILTHQLGTDSYAPLSVGEVVRGPIFILTVGYAFLKVRYRFSLVLISVLLGMSFLIGLQILFFQLTISEAIGTLLLGVRWVYLFFLLNYLLSYIRRHNISADVIVSQVKWVILIFYCVPILLSAAGIAGYTVYGDDSSRKGYGGFIMNSNVVASMLVFMLPFFLKFERPRDFFIFLIYLSSAILLGSKLTWISFAGILGIWFVYRVVRTIRHALHYGLHGRRNTLIILALFVAILVVSPFTPVVTKVADIYTGVADLYTFYVDGNAFGLESNIIDVLTSFRTLRIQRFMDWAQQPGNTLMLLIGGGAPNFDRLYGEIDWVDLATLFGLLGLIIFYSLVLFFLFHIYTSHRPYRIQVLAMLSLTLAVSLVSGHTFIAPATGTVLAVILGAFFGSPVVNINTARVQLPSQVGGAVSNPLHRSEQAKREHLNRASQQEAAGNL